MTHELEIIHGKQLKVGNQEPNLRVQLLENDYPFNLDAFGAGVGDVTLKLRRTDSDTNKVDATMTIEDAKRGLLSYSWSSGDTDTSGTYLLEVVVDDGTGEKVTWPSLNYERVYITGSL